MAKLPKKFIDRVQARLKPYQAIVVSHRTRDVSEADTVTVVKDVLADVFGYDKYAELTSEQQIRGTYCDLAVQIDGKIRFLIEVKGAGSTLSEAHLRQAVNYGAHQGIEWIILTNAVEWRFYKVTFAQPISWEEITRICLPEINPPARRPGAPVPAGARGPAHRRHQRLPPASAGGEPVHGRPGPAGRAGHRQRPPRNAPPLPRGPDRGGRHRRSGGGVDSKLITSRVLKMSPASRDDL
ncbi:MAG: hypothetical protein JWM33_269 [Caulobacteraceae bacterium]|nr:hypothetical protein [Caulobacteraceae bacterium]